MPDSTWTAVGPIADLPEGGSRVVKHGRHQLAVGRTSGGRIFAIDNRCPHEGYPLAQGDLRDCILTCAWHNWKFDVRDGTCVFGGEAVRSYPVRVADGAVLVDLAEPPLEEQVERGLASLERALFENDRGRALRDATRLLQAGYDARCMLADVARYDALHAENGTTHVLPLAADCARTLTRLPGVEALHAIAPVLDLCGESNRHLPVRPRPEPIAFATRDATRREDERLLGAEILRAVEEQETEHAEALLRGAFQGGVSRTTVEGWLYAILARHFTDFGHQLIYLVKAQELLDGLAPVDAALYAADLYPALLVSTALATREDTLPYLRAYFQRLAAVEDDLARTFARSRPGTPFDPAPVRDAALDGNIAQAFDTVWRTLQQGVPASAVAQALVIAAAERVLRFDTGVDRDPDVQEGWLDVTHRLTFASAARHAVQRCESPEALRFLVQTVAFVHAGRPLDAPPEGRCEPPGSTAAVDANELAAILDAVASRQPDVAVTRTSAWLRGGGAVELLRLGLEDFCLRGRFVRPIFDAHAVKTTWAGFEERKALFDSEIFIRSPDRDLPLLAAVRFLASPVVEKNLHASVRETLRWVVDGKVPRKLTQ